MGYALNHKLPVSYLKNKSGNFIQPNIQSVQTATTHINDNQSYTQSIVNSQNKDAYPISAFSFLLIYKEMKNPQGEIIVNFLKWALEDGQNFSKDLYYIPLPLNVIQQALKNIQKIKIIKDESS